MKKTKGIEVDGMKKRHYKYIKEKHGRRYKCPCCGNYTFEKKDDSLERCPVCFWTGIMADSMIIHRFGRKAKLTLKKARWNYYRHGVCDFIYFLFVRKPKEDEKPSICDEAYNLTDNMYEFIYNEFGISRDVFVTLPEDELDEYYEKLCDIEFLASVNNDMERCEKAADIVTILGDVYAPIRRRNHF